MRARRDQSSRESDQCELTKTQLDYLLELTNQMNIEIKFLVVFLKTDIPTPNISLTNVAWKDGLNELWEVGSDVDDIQLDPDFVLNPDSVTEDEASQRSGKSKSSSKSKSKESKKSHKSHKDKKDGDLKTPKLDAASVPSTSGLPSVSAPAPTVPAAENLNASETKKNKSKSKSRESFSEPRESSTSSSVQPDQQPSTSGLPSVSGPGTRFYHLAPTAPAAKKPNASKTKKRQSKSKED
ncbi:hypothetical protein CRE_30395 [Caenorhabditis remanei]|uniref:Uncharacterized protein n=1 Tax=Caenorhabditis remanei TaxID=31234 RepID=E3NAF2_CAERE|nr:hypothetical protein CRE_30395 [Caenorhabditis remanei]